MYKKNIHYSHYLESEILGACLLEESAFSRVFSFITEEMFYFDDHKNLFLFISEMFTNNIPLNLPAAFDYIFRVKHVEIISGSNVAYYLTKLTEKITGRTVANIEYFAVIIKQMFIERELIKLTSSGIKGENIRQEIGDLQIRLMELNANSTTKDWHDMSELIMELYSHQEEMTKTHGKGLQTGFPTIDRVYGGFFGGQTIIIGARPSVGKSAFAGNMAMNIARNYKQVGFISLEMNNKEIAARFAALDTNYSFTDIFRNLITDENDQERYNRIMGESTTKLPISVSEKTEVNVSDIKAKAYKLRHQKGRLDCIFLDYLQLVDGDTQSNRNRENEVSKISRGCKILAKEMNIPFIILCQLNREVDKRKGKERYPQLSDFRESGAIEQDADVAMFLHSDFKSGFTEDENGNSTENQADLVIRKWRNGVSNLIIPLDFDGPKMKFKERQTVYTSVNYYEPKEPDPF